MLNENIFQFNFQDPYKSEDDPFYAQLEANRECPSILWSPKHKSIRDEVSDCNRFCLESFPVTKEPYESPSPQSELSSTNNPAFLNPSNYIKVESGKPDSCKTLGTKKEAIEGSDFEGRLKNLTTISRLSAKKGKENFHTALNLIPISCELSNKENGVLEINQLNGGVGKIEPQRPKHV